MKTALLFFRRENEGLDKECYSVLENILNNSNINPTTIISLACNDDIGFKRYLLEFKDTVDNLIVIGEENTTFNFKQLIAQALDTVLVENDGARKVMNEFCDICSESDTNEFLLMPIESTVIPNTLGAYQGFIVDQNEFSLAVLPSNINEIKPMCEKYLIPFLEGKYALNCTKFTLKYFGDKIALNSAINEAKQEIKDELTVKVSESYGDYKIDLIFNNQDENQTKEVIRKILLRLKDNIYAEFDTTLSQRLFDLLKLKNLKLSVAESFTGGRVASSIISNSGVSNYLMEAIVAYSNKSKVKRLGVRETDLIKEGAVSSVVAYQMALGLLKTGECDVVISTTGIAGPRSDDTKKPVGLCYIAVGMKDGVHTYRYNFSGTREEITETAKNTALFLAIKKLKNI